MSGPPFASASVRRLRRSGIVGAIGLAGLVGLVGPTVAPRALAAPPDPAHRRAYLAQLADVREDIGRLQAELRRLSGRERDVETELERLRTDLRLRQAEVTEVRLRSERAAADREEARSRLETLEAEQARRRDYLAARLRRLYVEGPTATCAACSAGPGWRTTARACATRPTSTTATPT